MLSSHTCEICGQTFGLYKERHYIAREDIPSGVLLPGEQELYDAYDCPHCGSQFRAQIRKRTLKEVKPDEAAE